MAVLTGWPWAESGSGYSWYTLQDEYAPIAQLWSGVVERCELVGIDPPEDWVVTLNVNGGTSSYVTNVVSTNSTPWTTNTFTNTTLITDTLTVTNAFTPVEYHYVLDGATNTGHAHAAPTADLIGMIDDKLFELIPHFADPLLSEAKQTVQPLTVSNVWKSLQIGSYTQRADNAYRFTQQPESVRGWLLAESHYTGSWSLVDIAASPYGATDRLGSLRPVVHCPDFAGTPSVTIYGTDYSNAVAQETVSLSGEYTPCTIAWGDVTQLTADAWSPEIGTWYAVGYTNRLVAYGDHPYRLYTADLDERGAVLNALRMRIWQTNTTHYSDISAYGSGSSYAACASSITTAMASPTVITGSVFGVYASLFFSYVRRRSPTSYEGEAYTGRQNIEASGLPTNGVHTIKVYGYAEAPTYFGVTSRVDRVFDDFGDGYTNESWYVLASGTATNSSSVLSGWFGDTSFKLPIASDPQLPDYDISTRGYLFAAPTILVDGNFTY